jgi:hypothetical protein
MVRNAMTYQKAHVTRGDFAAPIVGGVCLAMIVADTGNYPHLRRLG